VLYAKKKISSFIARLGAASTDFYSFCFVIGKIAAQASHATLACYKYFITHQPDSPILRRWEQGGQAKIALQIKSEDELLLLQAQAMSLGLCARVIQDAGRTQIASGSRTVLGVLGPKSVVDGVTGHLKLL
jgi:PTH2 family peptidyl-tRNA hydrolase